MNSSVHNKLVSFIWSIADDCLRDVYVRGKYRDVILPMVVLRRLDVLLEPTKTAVLAEAEFQRKTLMLTDLEPGGLQRASGYVFYNTSKWTLQQLKDTVTNSTQTLADNFQDYLNGFSENVKEIVDKFKLRAQILHMADKDVLLGVLEKFTSADINLTPFERLDSDGRKLPPLTNLGMGYVFEELIRKFNEENNEEAGEHFTPREVIDLMTHIVIEPIKNKLPNIIKVYDPACGSGGMLTESQNFIKDEEGSIKAKNTDVYLYGKEINDETYAICKSDMMIKGNDPKNIKVGSTLSSDEFAGETFDFMLSNPPYGKSWANEVKNIRGEKGEIIDTRFCVRLTDYWGQETTAEATPRTSDGQLLFLMEMVSKMNPITGSRIASVHNGSSLFTGDAGGGESNIRRHIIEQDWLECIIQLPNNLFYNTGITTYIWVLSNRKSETRTGQVQLIDASLLYSKLRKNLGNKNCELTPSHIAEILKTYIEFVPVERSSGEGIASLIFDNSDFGYYKVTIERPKRLKAQFSEERIGELRFDKSLRAPMKWAYEKYGDLIYKELPLLKKVILEWAEENELNLSKKQSDQITSVEFWQKYQSLHKTAATLMNIIGTDEYMDYNLFRKKVEDALKQEKIKLSATDKNAIFSSVSWYDPEAEKVIKTKTKIKEAELSDLLDHLGCTESQLPDYGYYSSGEKEEYIQYETESDLRDTENVPLKENIYEYFMREVRPYVDESWINLNATKIGYEISFNKYFYRHKPLRSLEEVAADILSLDSASEGLIAEILNLENGV